VRTSREIVLRAGLPASVPGLTINRFCSTGLQTITMAAQQVLAGQNEVVVAGGLESISLVENEHMNDYCAVDPWLQTHRPDIFMSMLETAEVVAERYGISREAQDCFALESQRRTAAAQTAGRFDEEIVPIHTHKRVIDKQTGAASLEALTLQVDECNRPNTTSEGLASLRPVTKQGSITAGNASQLSDGAAAVVVMDGDLAARRGIEPHGVFRDFVVAGCEPDEMGIGPVLAVRSYSRSVGLDAALRLSRSAFVFCDHEVAEDRLLKAKRNSAAENSEPNVGALFRSSWREGSHTKR
jgi:acetyl-CoA C-acetyltransferase